jgi:hypothetical protein
VNGKSGFQQGMNLKEAAERLAPLAGLDPAEVAGFILLIVVDDDEQGPAVAASDNIPPHVAGHMLILAGNMLLKGPPTVRSGKGD